MISLELQNLSLNYGCRTVLRKVSASLSPGKITVLIGPNAVGKSSLLRCVLGDLRPTSGRALLNQRDSCSFRASEIARMVAYVPQRSPLAAPFAVRDVIELGRYALEGKSARVESAIVQLDLSSIAEQSYTTLSAGQQQRVIMARALAQIEPGGLLLLDEPTAAMDLHHTDQVLVRLRQLVTRSGISILLAMHDLVLAAQFADAAWLLHDTRLVKAGPIEQVLTPENLESVFQRSFELVKAPNGVRVPFPILESLSS